MLVLEFLSLEKKWLDSLRNTIYLKVFDDQKLPILAKYLLLNSMIDVHILESCSVKMALTCTGITNLNSDEFCKLVSDVEKL